MKFQVFSENEWIYPDTEIQEQNNAMLYSARNADTCFQVLTDYILSEGESISVDFVQEGCEAVVYQLLPAKDFYVFYNSNQ